MARGKPFATIDDCRLVTVPAHSDVRGTLSVLQNGNGAVPFHFDRIFFISNVPPGTTRANHAPKATHELIMPLTGELKVQLGDGRRRKLVLLDDPSRALYLPPCIWRVLLDFSTNALCAVLASGLYEDESYYENYEAFVNNLAEAQS